MFLASTAFTASTFLELNALIMLAFKTQSRGIEGEVLLRVCVCVRFPVCNCQMGFGE